MTKRRPAVDRRLHERIPLAIPIFVRGSDADGKEFLDFVTALNISAGGALLVGRRFLRPSSTVQLEIPTAPSPRVPIPSKPVRRLRARILRTSALNGYCLLALKFLAKLAPKPNRGKMVLTK